MDFLNQIRKRQKELKLSNILNFSPLTNEERKHLIKIYGLLAVGTMITALSCYVDIYFLKIPRFIASMISLFCSFALAGSCSYSHYGNVLPAASKKRLLYFAGISSSIGILMSDYIAYVNYLNPSILPLAFFGSLSIFSCFSLSAIFSKNRFVLFDTQITLFDFRRGNKDYIMHSICLYLDLVGLFTHLLRILGQKEEKKKK
ncbi:hypothetical protein AK88_01908 [Plasmodium fragile]|uniref:Bax inhibitor 1 n=1 Tax=Plasmodium fragile TaxID=5857 RepID=A0A0D9QS00_PLAFR|nr:uncharacterized protein AK88_01908 [Plasmodium fragile]KJP88456.1 hypothetical protein AK88_01908 [Plasmodium fragile]